MVVTMLPEESVVAEERAYAVLGNGATLTDGALYYRQYHKPVESHISLGEAIKAFLAEKSRQGLRERSTGRGRRACQRNCEGADKRIPCAPPSEYLPPNAQCELGRNESNIGSCDEQTEAQPGGSPIGVFGHDRPIDQENGKIEILQLRFMPVGLLRELVR